MRIFLTSKSKLKENDDNGKSPNLEKASFRSYSQTSTNLFVLSFAPTPTPTPTYFAEQTHVNMIGLISNIHNKF